MWWRRPGPARRVEGVPREPGGLDSGQVDRFADPHAPRRDLAQLGQGQGPVSVYAEVLNAEQRSQCVDGGSGIPGNQFASDVQDPQRVACAVGQRDRSSLTSVPRTDREIRTASTGGTCLAQTLTAVVAAPRRPDGPPEPSCAQPRRGRTRSPRPLPGRALTTLAAGRPSRNPTGGVAGKSA